MIGTAVEALARSQLLLNFPPTVDKMDEWKATIQSLLGFAEINKSPHAEPSQRPQAMLAAFASDQDGGTAPTV